MSVCTQSNKYQVTDSAPGQKKAKGKATAPARSESDHGPTPNPEPTPEPEPEPEHEPELEPTPAVKKKRGGKAPGAQKFTEGDEARLLSIVEVVLPSGGDMWKKVSKRSSASEPKTNKQ
jgi:hypothetical protein